MKRKVLSLFLILVLCFAFSSCSLPWEKKEVKKSPNESVQETEPVLAKEKVFESEDGLFCLTADENWEDAKNSLDIKDAALALSKDSKNYIVLIGEYKYNFPGEDGLEGYNKLVIKNLEKNIDEDETGDIEQVQLGDYEAIRTEIAGKVDEQKEAYTVYCVEMEEQYVQMICWTAEEDPRTAEAEFDKIAQTLAAPEEEEEVYY